MPRIFGGHHHRPVSRDAHCGPRVIPGHRPFHAHVRPGFFARHAFTSWYLPRLWAPRPIIAAPLYTTPIVTTPGPSYWANRTVNPFAAVAGAFMTVTGLALAALGIAAANPVVFGTGVALCAVGVITLAAS